LLVLSQVYEIDEAKQAKASKQASNQASNWISLRLWPSVSVD